MKIVAFLKSPAGNIALFVVLLVGGWFFVHRINVRDEAQARELTRIEKPDTAPLHASLPRTAAPFKPAPPVVITKAKPVLEPAPVARVAPPEGIAPAPRAAIRVPPPEPVKAKPRVPPLSLVAVSAPTPAAEAVGISGAYAPFGRLIPCETVITLESSKLDTPVLGLVTDDVWHNGRRIIPAGAEVHGRASLDRSRERIAASGRWVIVWRDASDLNGAELALNGIALEREKNDASGEFGLRDGSAGLVGDLLRTDSLQEMKLFAATFLSGVAGGLQQTQTLSTVGGVVQVTAGSARDGALRGASDVLNAYARQIQEAIARDGFFVRVPAGKQFYLYVTETIDQARANRAVADLWKRSHEN